MHADPAAIDVSPGQRLGRWTVVAPLGRGGMATVWRVSDPSTGGAAALKWMNSTDPGSLPEGVTAEELARRFVREFRTLARLDHPNIVRVVDHGVHGGRPWFAMELVEGEDVRTLVSREPTGAARWDEARAIVAQVARALRHVHGLGLVHRDVTPSNIRVLPDGSVRLMDFGVVKEQGQGELTGHGELLGTVAYVAPEQIAGEAVDARADLYGLGAVLYLLLTGRRPFQARTLAGYLEKHLHDVPRPPSEWVPDVPADLEALCMRLLQKDPAARPASANHVVRLLEGPEPGALAVAGDWPAELVGRTPEIAALEAALVACRDGVGGTWVIEGGAGSGKSRMARRVRDAARRLGLSVLTVRARDTGNPLDVYARVYAALCADGLPASPLLDRLFGPQGVDMHVARYSLFTAFRDMLASTGPRVACIDDLHRADEGSLQLLEYLVRNTRALADLPILWVFTRDPSLQGERLDAMVSGESTEVPAQRLPLAPLPPAAVEELVLAMVPDGPEARALAVRLAREGEGSPAYVVEMLRALLEDGVIEEPSSGAGGGAPPPATPPRPVRRFTRAADALARGPLPIPRSLRAQLATVLAPLGEGARALADALAVALGAGAASAEAPLGPLAEVAGVDGAAALAELVRVGLVRVVHRPGAEEAEGPLVEFVQPRTRDLLYAAIPAPARARLHRRTGESLERRYRRRMPLVVDALAEHFSAAGVAGKAYPYLVRAGARMLERSFVAEAERFFQRALAVEPEARELLVLEDADRLLCETLLRRAEALDHLGRWGDTAPDLARAAALAAELADDRLGSRVHAALGQRARQAHDVEEATTAFSRALALAERAGATELRVPALHGQGAIRWALGDLEGARRAWAETLQVGEATGDLRALALAQNGLGLVALCRGQSAEARKCFEQSAELFERLGLVAPLATARLNLVEIHHFTGNLRRGVELAERTLAHARETGHTLGIARARHHRALLLVDLGRFLEGREEAREALAAVRRLGQREDELATLVGRLRADWALGDLAEVRAGLIEADGLLERYDPEGFAPIVLAWRARVAWRDGDPTSARAALERALAWTGTAWPYQECRFELALGRVFAAFGDRAEATRRAEAAIRRADASGFRLYALKGHQVVAACGLDEAQVARHRRVADALARSLAANLGREDAQRFLELAFAPDALAAGAF